MPIEWIAWYEKFHNNLHVSEKELESVEVGAGEWDTEYAKVVKSALRFQDCIAHVGGEGWGKDGSPFADVQLRAYLTPLSEEQVYQAASAQGLGTAQRIDPHAFLLPTVKDGPWQRTTIKYELFYYDYGGTARVDFYTRTDQGLTFVLVFMYCDVDRFGAAEEVKSVLRSFRFAVP